jgi:4-hydroxybenzoate polyprenyltransferase
LATASLLAALGIQMELHWEYGVSLAIAVGIWFQQYRQLRQPEIPKPVYGEIFRQNVWVGFILLAGMISGTLL